MGNSFLGAKSSELGCSPHPWQDAIVAAMSADGRSPSATDLRPTDLRIAIFAADTDEARQAEARLKKRYASVEPGEAEVIVALGGDGMMLETLHRFIGRDLPIYGMNCGTVGFLMNLYSEDNLPARLTRAQTVQLHPLLMTAR